MIDLPHPAVLSIHMKRRTWLDPVDWECIISIEQSQYHGRGKTADAAFENASAGARFHVSAPRKFANIILDL